MRKYAVVILAAGSSSRFGQVKQLAAFNNKKFIEHALAEAALVVKNIFVVLGSKADIIKKEIKHFPSHIVHIVYNQNWEDGMASSICSGLSEVLKTDPAINGVIFMVCDQPFVTSALLNELITKQEVTKKTIVACSYKGATGTPVLFDKIFFPELLTLTGQAGAKKIVSENPGSTITVPFPLGYIDIDTKEDYEALQKNKFNS